MAIQIADGFRLAGQQDGELYAFDTSIIDLKTGKTTLSKRVVLYSTGDVKKLAIAKKISYFDALKYFTIIGIDDHSGASIFVPEPQRN